MTINKNKDSINLRNIIKNIYHINIISLSRDPFEEMTYKNINSGAEPSRLGSLLKFFMISYLTLFLSSQ